MFQKVKSLFSKRSVKTFLCGLLVCGAVMGANPQTAKAEETAIGTVIDFVDMQVYQNQVQKMAEDSIDAVKGYLAPLFLVFTGGGILIGVMSTMANKVTKKVIGMARRA